MFYKLKRLKTSITCINFKGFTRQYFLCIFLAFALSNSHAQVGSDGLVKTGALIKLDHLFAFTEGPVTDKTGNLYFTDQPNNAIWEYTITNEFRLFMQPAGRANGMYVDKAGNLLVCADLYNQIWQINPATKQVDTLLRFYQGRLLNGPNDLWTDQAGGIYFTDPYYQRDYWARQRSEQDKACVYYLPKGAHEAKRVAETLVKPNGIVGSKDGKYLYVSDIEGKKIYRFDRGRDGALSNPRVILHHVADGITIDQNDHLYLSGNGVTIINKEGRILNYIPVDEPWVSNVSFGGKDHNILFITASKHLYKIQTDQKGIMP